MATYGWGTGHSVEEWLFAEGYRFDFFQAVNLLEQLASAQATADPAPLGEGDEPGREALRLRATVGNTFAPSDVARIKPGMPNELEARFLTLAGPMGPLPPPYVEMIRQALRRGREPAVKDFLDIFHHRLLSILYRVRKKHRIALDRRPPDEGRLANVLFALMGLGTQGMRGRLAVPDRALTRYVGLLNEQPRSLHGLERILSDYFGVTVRGRSFVGAWQSLEADDLTVIGRDGRNNALGQGVVLGSRIWDQGAGVELRFAPLSLAQYRDFLPIGSRYRPFVELTCFYLGEDTGFQFRLSVQPEQVPTSTLAPKGDMRLGWTAWLNSGGGGVKEASALCLTPPSRINRLRSLRIPLFRLLLPDELDLLVRHMHYHRISLGQLITRQSDPGGSLFVLLAGKAKLSRRSPAGKATKVALEAGAVIGEESFFAGTIRHATCVASDTCDLLELSCAGLEEAVRVFPRIGVLIRQGLKARAGRADGKEAAGGFVPSAPSAGAS